MILGWVCFDEVLAWVHATDEYMLIFTFSHLFSLENGLFWDEFVLTKFWPELTLQMSTCWFSRFLIYFHWRTDYFGMSLFWQSFGLSSRYRWVHADFHVFSCIFTGERMILGWVHGLGQVCCFVFGWVCFVWYWKTPGLLLSPILQHVGIAYQRQYVLMTVRASSVNGMSSKKKPWPGLLFLTRQTAGYLRWFSAVFRSLSYFFSGIIRWHRILPGTSDRSVCWVFCLALTLTTLLYLSRKIACFMYHDFQQFSGLSRTSFQELSGDVGSCLAPQIGRFDVENLDSKNPEIYHDFLPFSGKNPESYHVFRTFPGANPEFCHVFLPFQVRILKSAMFFWFFQVRILEFSMIFRSRLVVWDCR